MKRNTLSIFILGLFLLAACVPTTPGGSTPTEVIPNPPTTAPTVTPIPTVVAPEPTATSIPTAVPPQPTATHIPVDLSPAQRAAIEALSKKNDIPVDQIKLVSTEAVSWPTGCLGVVLPGVMCTQGPVDGFRILLAANGKQFEYHTNQDGTSVLAATQQLALIQLAVFTAQNTVQLVDPNIPLGPTYNPAFNGFLSAGDAISGTAYVLNFTSPTRAQAVDASGAHNLAFIKNINYGLAIWRGGLGTQPRLAWGTQPSGEVKSSFLQTSAPDGSNLETLLSLDTSANPPMQLVAEFWSADGQSLYFSKEPLGIGGYILFGGASSLYKIDIATKQVSELIPMGAASRPMICLDALSGDYRFVADHCSQNTITVRDLASGTNATIQPPAGVKDFRILGSARFSPDGKQLAFALAKGNPDSEQGWVAVADSAGGGSKLILTAQAGVYYSVVGWLADQTLLVQSNSLQCNPTCDSQLWMVGTDGSNLTKVADGRFLAVIDNPHP